MKTALKAAEAKGGGKDGKDGKGGKNGGKDGKDGKGGDRPQMRQNFLRGNCSKSGDQRKYSHALKTAQKVISAVYAGAAGAGASSPAGGGSGAAQSGASGPSAAPGQQAPAAGGAPQVAALATGVHPRDGDQQQPYLHVSQESLDILILDGSALRRGRERVPSLR